MQSLETQLLTYVLNSLWQVPVVFAAAWLAARVTRPAGAAFHHRLWTTALLTEIFLPACSVQPVSTLRALQHWVLHHEETTHNSARVTVLMGPAYATGGLHLAPALLPAVSLLYLGTVLYFAARLSLGLYRTVSLRHRAEPVRLTGYASESYERYARLFDVKDAAIATSSEIASPITLGIRSRLLLLPAQIDADLLGEDLDAVFAHEFAHMRRRDFAKNLAYELLSLPAAFHPLLWLTRTRVAESREIVCDAMAAQLVAGRQRYAHSLLRLASKFSELSHAATTPHAIGIFDANHFKNFERRIMNLTENPIELRGLRRFTTAAACMAIGLGTCTSALALRMHVATLKDPSTNQTAKSSDSSTVPSHPTLIFSKPPEYPAASRAKKEMINGTVIVALVVSKDGLPTDVAIKKSLRPDFDQSAIETVKQYRFTPALLNGKPVECPLTISVNFQIF